MVPKSSLIRDQRNFQTSPPNLFNLNSRISTHSACEYPSNGRPFVQSGRNMTVCNNSNLISWYHNHAVPKHELQAMHYTAHERSVTLQLSTYFMSKSRTAFSICFAILYLSYCYRSIVPDVSSSCNYRQFRLFKNFKNATKLSITVSSAEMPPLLLRLFVCL